MIRSRRCLTCLCLLVAGAAFGAAVDKVEPVAGGFTAVVEGGTLSVTAVAPGIVRVAFMRAGAQAGPRVPAVVLQPGKEGARVSTQGGETLLTAPGAGAVLVHETGALRFLDDKGTVLLEEAPGARLVKETTVEGVKTWQTGQGFRRRADERLFGLGAVDDKALARPGKVDLRQESTRICVPVLGSSRGWLLFWDNPALTTVTLSADAIAWDSEAGDGLEYYVMTGPRLADSLGSFARLTGTAPMPPRWALGLWFGRSRYTTEQELSAAAAEFRARGIPLDALIQDYGYWGDQWGTHSFDGTRYLDPKWMIQRLHNEQRVQLALSVWPKLDPNCDNGKALAEAGGLLPPGNWGGGNWDWAGNLRYYDPFKPAARALFWRQVKEALLDKGVDAWWLEGSEPEIRGTWHAADTGMGKGARVYNAYPLMHALTFYEGQRATDVDRRVVLVSRSAWAGQQRTGSTCWMGPVEGNWDALRHEIEAGPNLSVAGLPYWSSAIGGFSAQYGTERYSELFVRWLQWGAFCPTMIIHGAGQPYPWEMGDDVERNVTKYARLRYRLMPYIYSQAWNVTKRGAPLVRPLVVDFPADARAAAMPRQFMFGPALLAAPITSPFFEYDEVIPSENLIDDDGKPGALTGAYYNGLSFDKLVLTRRDPKVAFLWNQDRPAPEVDPDLFTVRWTGKVRAPAEGLYEFSTRADDGVRLWVDGKLIVDDWNVHATEVRSGTIRLEAGKDYPIKLEFFENYVIAEVQLRWRLPKGAQVKQQWDAYLPAGATWIDFWTGQRYEGGQYVTVPAPLDTLPLFARAGEIVPMGPDMEYAGQNPADPIELRVYPGADAAFTLYEDRGDGYGYEKGEHAIIPITWSEATRTLTVGKREGAYPGMAAERTFRVVLVDTDKGWGIGPAWTADGELKYTGAAVQARFPAPEPAEGPSERAQKGGPTRP